MLCLSSVLFVNRFHFTLKLQLVSLSGEMTIEVKRGALSLSLPAPPCREKCCARHQIRLKTVGLTLLFGAVGGTRGTRVIPSHVSLFGFSDHFSNNEKQIFFIRVTYCSFNVYLMLIVLIDLFICFFSHGKSKWFYNFKKKLPGLCMSMPTQMFYLALPECTQYQEIIFHIFKVSFELLDELHSEKNPTVNLMLSS